MHSNLNENFGGGKYFNESMMSYLLSIDVLTADWLILEILASLGITALFLVIVTFICYKKRKW